MLIHLAEIANKLDKHGFFKLANSIDKLIQSLAKSELTKEAKIKNLPVISTVVLFRNKNGQLEVLIEERGVKPEKAQWALPGGHLEEFDDGKVENAADGGSRELHEETGVYVAPKELIFVLDKVRTKGKKKHDICYTAIIPSSESKAVAGSDAASVRWCPVTKLPRMAFDHNFFVEEAMRKLFDKEKVLSVPSVDKLHLPVRSNQGFLIVFEGIDGSGKSTQMAKLCESLEKAGYDAKSTKWGDSAGLQKTIKKYKKDHKLPPKLYSLIYAADMYERYSNNILPWLAEGKVVVCDRYIYTSFVRDMLRDVDPRVLEVAYSNFIKPDLIFFCNVAPKVALKRLEGDRGLGYYGAGIDLHLDSDPQKNYLKYQEKIVQFYHKILRDIDTVLNLNTEKNPDDVAGEIFNKVMKAIKKREPRLS